jgi:hypothetical protein
MIFLMSEVFFNFVDMVIGVGVEEEDLDDDDEDDDEEEEVLLAMLMEQQKVKIILLATLLCGIAPPLNLGLPSILK